MEQKIRTNSVYLFRFCLKCNEHTEHYRSSGQCIHCKVRLQREWREKHPAETVAQWKRWNNANPERRRQINRESKARRKQQELNAETPTLNKEAQSDQATE